MNKNMRKMYSEEEIAKLIEKENFAKVYSHNVIIVDNTDVDNPITTVLQILIPKNVIITRYNLYPVISVLMSRGTVNDRKNIIMYAKAPLPNVKIGYLDCTDSTVKEIALGIPNNLTVTDEITVIS